ncbi:MAG: DUF1320 family protein [Methylotenera sp.]|nr:DUF1320 family protein [Methylotenera sp.]
MTYVTATNMITQFGAEEIAQRSDRGLPRLITPELLTAAATGEDLSGYTVDEQAAVAAALSLINSKLLDAESTVNGFLSGRYSVPLVTVPRLVMTITCDLTRYALYDDMATEAISNRNADALKLLKSISKGEISLGIDSDGNKPKANDGAQLVSNGRVFSRQDGGFI